MINNDAEIIKVNNLIYFCQSIGFSTKSASALQANNIINNLSSSIISQRATASSNSQITTQDKAILDDLYSKQLVICSTLLGSANLSGDIAAKINALKSQKENLLSDTLYSKTTK